MVDRIFIVGAQKSGTSSLAAYLEMSGVVRFLRPKEPNYFAAPDGMLAFSGPGDEIIEDNSVLNTRSYEDLVSDAGRSGRRVGDASTMYLYSKVAASNIASRHPDARIIVLLRNPVDRAYSSFWHLRRNGRESVENFVDALALEDQRAGSGYEFLWRYADVGLYSAQLERYFAKFKREQIFVGIFEHFVRDEEKFTNDVLRFLGCTSTFRIGGRFTVNTSGSVKNPLFQKLLAMPGPWKDACRRLVPSRLWRPVFSLLTKSNLAAKPPLDPDFRSRFRHDVFSKDIERVEGLLGFEIPEWK